MTMPNPPASPITEEAPSDTTISDEDDHDDGASDTDSDVSTDDDGEYALFRWDSGFDADRAFDWLARQAPMLGKEYKVPPDDLTLSEFSPSFISSFFADEELG